MAENSHYEEDFEDEEEEEVEDWDDWEDEEGDVEDSNSNANSSSNLLCLFCDKTFTSCELLFDHCNSVHRFNFDGVNKALDLDFYGTFKLINYVRSQVAENRCWSCGVNCISIEDLRDHLHETKSLDHIRMNLDDAKYLKPFLLEDPLLYSFDAEEDKDMDYSKFVTEEDFVMDSINMENFSIDADISIEKVAGTSRYIGKDGLKEVGCSDDVDVACSSDSLSQQRMTGYSADAKVNGDLRMHVGSSSGEDKEKEQRHHLKHRDAKNTRNVNENYFGSYSTYGIHRDMLSDKVRMDAYSQAILRNPSLLNGAVVMDVGCGTGILSLFAAQAGASKVIAIEASQKMAAVATQIAKDNGLWQKGKVGHADKRGGVVEVVNSMVEDLDNCIQIQPRSIDILVSEWMGYCLLYESMLSSVLFARDRWLKPGGAMLPDTATIFAAGFGRGATSLPFWESVYGFNMSSIGKEIVADACRSPIVDVVSASDLVTEAGLLKEFDLVTMEADEVDFTASVMLEPKPTEAANTGCGKTDCYGVVLWFETGFTNRFCKEIPAVLSTSPYTLKTHWAQTILTFCEPITMSLGNQNSDGLSAVGTDANPAKKVHLRISIARGVEHRSIDISMETIGIGPDGRKRSWPVQIFNMV